MFDKSNISIVIANPKFPRRDAACRTNQGAGLAGRQPVHLLRHRGAGLGLDRDALRAAQRHHGEPRDLGGDLFLVRRFAKLRHAARLAHRLGRRRGGLLSGDAGFGRQLVRIARARQGDVLLVDRHHDRADAHRPAGHQPDRLLRVARTILRPRRARARPAAADGVVSGARQAGAASRRQQGGSRSGAGGRDREQRRCAGPDPQDRG